MNPEQQTTVAVVLVAALLVAAFLLRRRKNQADPPGTENQKRSPIKLARKIVGGIAYVLGSAIAVFCLVAVLKGLLGLANLESDPVSIRSQFGPGADVVVDARRYMLLADLTGGLILLGVSILALVGGRYLYYGHAIGRAK